MTKLFLTLTLCSSIAFAAVPPKQTNPSKPKGISARLTDAKEKTSAARKSNFSNILTVDERCCS
jgi:hypothetical protein